MMFRPQFSKKKSGFTLIELLIVISIIGILAALLLANFSGTRERARDTKRKSDLNQMKNALRLWYNDYQKYPATGTEMTSGKGDTRIGGCGTGATPSSDCSWGSAFTANNVTYMNQLPVDPLNDNAHVYAYQQGNSLDTTSNAFLISTTLENVSDTSSADSQKRCGISTPVALVYTVCSD